MNRTSNTMPSPAGIPGPADIREFETGPSGRRTRRAGPLAHRCPFRRRRDRPGDGGGERLSPEMFG